ncbi:sensor histidine kinase [Cohnella cellulosilytica]|uniref:Sensor histidine kinase n=1 Tax=Cohnella cellulosilytica TaxID=986710 RepID=A0ABW2F5U8_9BACL
MTYARLLVRLWDAIWNYSLKRKMLTFSLLMIMIPTLVIGFYFIRVVDSILTDNNYKEFERLSENIYLNLSAQIDLIENTYFNLISDPLFRDNVDKLQLAGEDKLRANEQIDLRMQSFLYFNYPWNSKLLQSIYVFIDEETSYFYDYNNIYYNNFSYNNEDRNKSMVQTVGLSWAEVRSLIGGNERINRLVPPDEENGMLYYARDFYDIYRVQFKGMIVLGIDEEVLSRIYSNALQSERSFGAVMNRNGVFLSHSDKSLLGRFAPQQLARLSRTAAFEEIVIDGETYLASARDIGSRGLTTVIAIPKDEVFAELIAGIRNYLMLLLLFFSLLLVIHLLLSSRVSRQITSWIRKIETVQQGNYDIRMEDFKEYELSKLSRIFNEMTRQIKYLIQEVYQKRLLIKEAELKSLQAQMNPHFLFNTLLSIGWKAKMSGDEEVYNMVSSLSELMKSSIYSGPGDKTTVGSELQNVDFYLYLQQARFGNKIEIDRGGIDERVKEYYLPKLCLQPLVENAIVHGLESKIGRCLLRISAQERAGELVFEIEDNGVGFDARVLDLDGAALSAPPLPNHSNIGLVNTHKRIRYLYGDDYGLTVRSAIGQGTRVTVTLPLDRGDER